MCIDSDGLAFVVSHLAQLDEDRRTVAAGRLMGRAVRATQIPASRVIHPVFSKRPAQDQNFFATGVAVLGKHRCRRIAHKAGCTGLLPTYPVEHDAFHPRLRGRYPAIVIRRDDGSLREISIQ